MRGSQWFRFRPQCGLVRCRANLNHPSCGFDPGERRALGQRHRHSHQPGRLLMSCGSPGATTGRVPSRTTAIRVDWLILRDMRPWYSFTDAPSIRTIEPGARVRTWTPVLVFPTGFVALFFPRVVFKKTKGNLFLLTTNGLLSHVVRNDFDFDFDFLIVPVQFTQPTDFLRISRGG